jgi:GNAT superfamily N-acetyltransferase
MAQQHPVEIRPFRPGEESQVLALAPRLTEWVAAWREPAAVLRAAQDWLTGSLGTAGQPGHMVYVAVSDGRVAGVVTVCEHAHFTGQTDAYVGELAVAPGLDRRGIASALMDAAEGWAARCGLAFLTLETGAANRAARLFYAQRGYLDEDVRLTKAIT